MIIGANLWYTAQSDPTERFAIPPHILQQQKEIINSTSILSDFLSYYICDPRPNGTDNNPLGIDRDTLWNDYQVYIKQFEKKLGNINLKKYESLKNLLKILNLY